MIFRSGDKNTTFDRSTQGVWTDHIFHPLESLCWKLTFYGTCKERAFTSLALLIESYGPLGRDSGLVFLGASLRQVVVEIEAEQQLGHRFHGGCVASEPVQGARLSGDMPHLRGRAATDGALPAARRRLDARRSGTDSLVGSVRRSGRVGPRPSRAPAAAAAAAAPTVTIRAGRRRCPRRRIGQRPRQPWRRHHPIRLPACIALPAALR